jgi:hypothetical protein
MDALLRAATAATDAAETAHPFTSAAASSAAAAVDHDLLCEGDDDTQNSECGTHALADDAIERSATGVSRQSGRLRRRSFPGSAPSPEGDDDRTDALVLEATATATTGSGLNDTSHQFFLHHGLRVVLHTMAMRDDALRARLAESGSTFVVQVIATPIAVDGGTTAAVPPMNHGSRFVLTTLKHSRCVCHSVCGSLPAPSRHLLTSTDANSFFAWPRTACRPQDGVVDLLGNGHNLLL